MEAPALILSITTVPTRESAFKIARALVDERLAACVSMAAGVHSVYRWEGAVEESDEVILLIKTTPERYQALEARLKALHPYETPEHIALPAANVLPAYLAWVKDSVG